MQSAIRHIFPARCISCGELVETDFALCGCCWRETPFITGLACDKCGTPLPGAGDDVPELCDDCLRIARPWHKARAVMLYRDNARKLVLALKHGDRTDLARPAGVWLHRAAQDILTPDTIIVPVPLHWFRLLRRCYNQAALLAQALARQAGLPCQPDLLRRTRRTAPLDGVGRDERFKMLSGAIGAHPRRCVRFRGRKVLLVDDVMTSGATLAACTEACHVAGATRVSVLALARVVKDA